MVESTQHLFDVLDTAVLESVIDSKSIKEYCLSQELTEVRQDVCKYIYIYQTCKPTRKQQTCSTVSKAVWYKFETLESLDSSNDIRKSIVVFYCMVTCMSPSQSQSSSLDISYVYSQRQGFVFCFCDFTSLLQHVYDVYNRTSNWICCCLEEALFLFGWVTLAVCVKMM